MDDLKVKKEIIIKRVSAFKFEIEVSNDVSPPCNKPQVSVKTPERLNAEVPSNNVNVQRISVIQRAPPSNPKVPEVIQPDEKVETPKRSDSGFQDATSLPPGAVLIKDAIMYRIVEILLWKLLGEDRLSRCGYPIAPTYQVLWRAVYFSCLEPGARKPAVIPLPQDHDCCGNVACFMDHVSRFLEICAPTREIWKTFGWTRLSVEDILKKIYHEDLVPYLNNADLSRHSNILHAHADIMLLEKWEEQGFTAISWNGYKHFSEVTSDKDKCPECSHEAPTVKDNILWHLPSSRSQMGGDKVSPVQDCKGHAQNYFCTQCIFRQNDERMTLKRERPVSKTETTSVSETYVKKRGRPSFKNSDKEYMKKSKRILLWKFIYNLVEDPGTDDYIRWVDRREGVFQIINSEWLARTWGRNHGNPKMTYEKMARAMRTYYRSKVLQSVPRSYDYPRKLIYRFNPRVIHDLQEAGKAKT